MIKFKRIDKKLLFWFLILAIIPLGIMGFISYNTGVKTVREQTYENLSLVAASVKGHVQTLIQSQKNIIRDFASDKEIITSLKMLNQLDQSDKADPTIIERLKWHILLNKLVLYPPVLLSISILDNAGHAVYSTNENSIGRDELFKECFIHVKNDGFFCDLHYSQIFNERVIKVSAPVIDYKTHTLLGVIVNTISGTILGDVTHSRWLKKYGGIVDQHTTGSYLYDKESPVFDSASGGHIPKVNKGLQGIKPQPLVQKHSILSDIGSTGDVYIVNKDKQMVTQSRLVDNSSLNYVVDTEPVRRALIDGEEMVGIYKDHRGVPIIGASVFINDLRWVILVEKDRSYIFAPLFRLKAQMITFGILLLGIVILVSTSVSKKLTEPIKRLIEATKHHSKGVTDYRAKKISNDELGKLVDSFNEMCDDVREITISRDFFERVLNSMSDSVIITDLNYNIKYTNRSTIEMLGYAEDELVNRSFFSIIFAGKVFTNLKETITTNSMYIVKNQDVTYRTKDRKGVAVDFSSLFTRDCKHRVHIADCKFFMEGNTCNNCKEINIVNIAHDITHHKKTEARLQKAKNAAEYSARVRSEYLASMSHEIRTPLNAILGMSEVLREEIYGPLNEKQSKSLQNIETGGKHLLLLINDILDISKIEAGKLTLEYSPVSVKSVCETSLLFIKQEANKKGIKVVNILDDKISTVDADELRLKQILVNLLSNAVKFTPEGGSIGLEVFGKKDKNLINFTVRDNGIGISQQDLEQVFKPFTQFINSNSSNNLFGTGLGLALVKQMTELHGGYVFVESEKGKGSRFTVALPLKKLSRTEETEGRKEEIEIALNEMEEPFHNSKENQEALL